MSWHLSAGIHQTKINFFSGHPYPPENCTIKDGPKVEMQLVCTPNYNGGLKQSFVLEVRHFGTFMSNHFLINAIFTFIATCVTYKELPLDPLPHSTPPPTPHTHKHKSFYSIKNYGSILNKFPNLTKNRMAKPNTWQILTTNFGSPEN